MSFNPCIIVPVYNHAGVPSLMARIPGHLFVILVDDGSSSPCAGELARLDREHERLTLIRHDRNTGKGGAVMTALQAAHNRKFTHALQIDADGQHDAGDIPAFLDLSRENPEAFISGRPVYENISAGRYWGRYVTHVFVWLETLSFSIKDSMIGFRVYPLRSTIHIIRSHRLGLRMDFDVEILVRLYWGSVQILWLPTRVVYGADDDSHFRPCRDNLLISRMHARLLLGMVWRFPQLMARKFQ